MSVPMDPREIFSACASVFDEVADAVYVCDLKGKLLFLNKAAEKLDGFQLETVRGKDVADLYGTESGISPLLEALRTRETVRKPRYSYWIHGREVVQSCVASPLFLAGEIVGAYSVQHDMTEMRQMVEENLELQREVEQHRLKKAEPLAARYDLQFLIGGKRILRGMSGHGSPGGGNRLLGDAGRCHRQRERAFCPGHS